MDVGEAWILKRFFCEECYCSASFNPPASDVHMSVKSIMEPGSVLLVGSSSIREEVGMSSPEGFHAISKNLRGYFKGTTRIIDIEDPPVEISPAELAVIMLPPGESVEWLGKLAGRVRGVIQITGGFPEDLKREFRRTAVRNGIRVLGPNTIMGVINTANGLNTTFEEGLMPPEGNIAIVSQSGGVGATLLDWAVYYGIGVSKFIFTGEKMDVDDIDILSYLDRDPQTRVIAAYIEGVKHGREFVEKVREITSRKPVLVLKSGKTEEGARRALSHTASVAGSDNIFDAAFKEAGMIRVDGIEELFIGATALSMQPLMRGDRVAIVSNVGGPAIIAADDVTAERLKLARLSRAVCKDIHARYPGVDVMNPVDTIADARAERFEYIVSRVLRDENVDGVMVINMMKSCFFQPGDARVIGEMAVSSEKPIVDIPCGGDDFARVSAVLKDYPLPTYNLPVKGAKALRILHDYWKIRNRELGTGV